MDNSLSQAIESLVAAKPTWAVLTLIGLNLALGIINALKDGKFNFYEAADIAKKIAPIAITYLVIGVGSELALTDQLAGVVNTLIAVIAGMPFLASSLKEVNAMGVPVNKLLGPALTKAVASKPVPESPPGSGIPSLAALDALITEGRAKGWTDDQIRAEGKKRGIPIA